MTINWGTKIIMLYAGFVLLIGTLVWKSVHTKFELVSADYYEQEIGFQKKLNARTATAQLISKPVVSVTPQAIIVFFPTDFYNKEIIAELKLYNPAGAALDKAFAGLRPHMGRLEISRNKLPSANYIAQLSWQCEGRNYYQETPVNLSVR